jgi:hypothetical protein
MASKAVAPAGSAVSEEALHAAVGLGVREDRYDDLNPAGSGPGCHRCLRITQYPSACTTARPSRGSHLHADPAHVRSLDEPANLIAENEVSEGGAARCPAQVDVAGAHLRRSGDSAYLGQRPAVAMSAAGIWVPSIEVGVRGPAREPLERWVGLQGRQQHPAGLGRYRRHAIAPYEAIHRSAQRRRIQASRIPRRLTREMLAGDKVDRLAAVALDRRRARTRTQPQRRRPNGAPRLIGDVHEVRPKQAPRERQSRPASRPPLRVLAP